ncbi:LamG domain-containing protein [Dyella japonica]|uniref:LamG-like jellyroll fold domain-containing protein n=1 Tax=Dyella japonica DSM 16301 TaxID=1440762 RepID=A0A0G9H751_9GAMM|nr:LamG domain-containing protein [Dyella japonica]KLD65423.1 hypothetical protein Y882_02560 [Dyella japonica DSM 16301]
MAVPVYRVVAQTDGGGAPLPPSNFGFMSAFKTSLLVAPSARALPPGGIGYIAGDAPDGLVTFNGAPAVRVLDLFDRASNALVASTVSGVDGSYLFTGLAMDRVYDVRARGLDTHENDVIASQIRPVVTAMRISGTFGPAAFATTYLSAVTINGGSGVYTNPRVTAGSLPPGISLSVAGPFLSASGSPTEQGSSTLTVAVDSSDGQTVFTTQTIVVGADTFAANVTSLLHFDGADASTVFTDQVGRVWASSGAAKISTAKSVFGGASGFFDGASYISTPSVAALNLVGVDFAIECRIYPTAFSSTTNTIIDKDGVSGATYPSYALGINPNGTLRFIIGSGNSTAGFQAFNSTLAVALGGWYHVAVSREGNALRLFVNGALDSATTITANMIDGGKPVLIGYETGQPAASYFNGYMDELRVTKGAARYTSSFIPPTIAY